MSKRLLEKSYSELSLALANDYESIYVIDNEDDSYVEYMAAGTDKAMTVRSSGDNFYEDVIYNCRMLVWPEDQGKFLRTFRKENVLAKLEHGDSFSLSYRLNFDNKPVYYFLKTIRSNSSDIIIGVQNVDKQVRREEKEREKYMVYGEIAKSLGSIYEVIYYIDAETGKYIEYYSSQSFSDLGIESDGGDFFENLKTDIEKHIYHADQKMLIEELDKYNLLNTLKEKGMHSLVYRQVLGGRMQYVSLIAFKQHEDSNHIVIAVRNVDSEMQKELTIAEESKLFNEIAMALAQRYDVIYRIDINTDEFMEFSSSKQYSKIDNDELGEDFFGLTRQNLKKDIYPDDYPMMAAAMEKENLLSGLRRSGKLFLNYRLMINGKPQYTTLFAVLPEETSDHIIVAVSNVDETRRIEESFEGAMNDMQSISDTDILTGLQNKLAYVKNEMNLDDEISKKKNLPLAIVVCDINGLREINDTQGHKVGDECIIDSGNLLKDIYKNSKIFRYGGDEFAIILTGEDYEDRKQLLKKLSGILASNRLNREITFAYGMAEFDSEIDMKVQDVLGRAFSAMRVNKQSLKGWMPHSGTDESDRYIKLSADEKALKFYDLFTKLISRMADIKNDTEANVSAIEELLIEISSMHRLSKAVTRLYRNPQEEAAGGGETLCCFDTGIEGEELLSFRVVTSVMSIATMKAYMSPDEEPLTDEELWRVELVMRATLSYVSRNRLTKLVEELAFQDDSGFPSQRSLFRYISTRKNSLGGMVAVRYNLLHFTLVNQELGRKAGDHILRRHFEGVQKLIGDNGIVVRLGGDNFVALFEYRKMGNVFTYLTEAPIIYDNTEGKCVNISTTIGVFRIPREAVIQNPGEILEKINTAYRTAKAGGNERIVFYNDSQLTARSGSMKVQQMFPEALRNEEFQVYYQPKVHTGTGRLIGAEALCRWFHNNQMISPGEFIPVLEETDDICKLDFYMLDHVCRDIRRWLNQGMKVVRVSVNLSRKHMVNSHLLENILKIIDRHNVPHSCIEIELTETTTDVSFNDLKRVVSGLQGEGIFTAVDDFGIGYSSLNLIRSLPWNVLKVDRSFLPVEDDDPNSVNSVMFKHVIAMVNELGIECIVEGVETQRQLEILRANNCFYAQGFLFDRPLPVSDFEQRMVHEFYPINFE